MNRVSVGVNNFGEVMSNSRNTVARPIQPILSLNIGMRALRDDLWSVGTSQSPPGDWRGKRVNKFYSLMFSCKTRESITWEARCGISLCCWGAEGSPPSGEKGAACECGLVRLVCDTELLAGSDFALHHSRNVYISRTRHDTCQTQRGHARDLAAGAL